MNQRVKQQMMSRCQLDWAMGIPRDLVMHDLGEGVEQIVLPNAGGPSSICQRPE